MKTSSEKWPSVFDFSDYREFLKEFSHSLKDHRDLSIRKIAELAGFKNPVFLSRVIQKKASLTKRSAQQLANRFGLKALESDYLCELVQLNDAKSDDVRNRSLERLLKLSSKVKVRTLIESECQYFEDWLVPAIFELLSHKALRKMQSAELALNLNLPKSRVEDALQCLLKVGLISESNAGWQKAAESLKTLPEIGMIQAKRFHRTMLAKASESLENDQSEERGFFALSIALNSEGFLKLKQKLYEVCEEAMLQNRALDEDDISVYQLNLNLFPLLRPKA